MNNSIEIKNADFSIDNLNNLITINKIKGKYLEIAFKGYDLYSEKLNIKKYKNDTTARQLIHQESVILYRFKQIWGRDIETSDTLVFNNVNEAKSYILSYLKYLKILDKYCDNEICSYSNKYRYQITFAVENSEFKISSIEKLQPHENNCDELGNISIN